MQRVATLLALVLLLLGAILLFLAAPIPRYTDAAAFDQGVAALSREYSNERATQGKALGMSSDATSALYRHMETVEARLNDKYWDLRDIYETKRRPFKDYGGTALVIGAALLLVARLGSRVLRTPPRRGLLQLAMFVPPLLTFGAFALDAGRMIGEDLVPWGDGPGEAFLMMGFLVFGPLPIIWMILHLLLIPEVYYRSQPLAIAWSRWVNPWLGLLALLAAVASVLTACYGQWAWMLASLAWLYIYLCMAASRRANTLFADQEKTWPPAWNQPA
jgi:hypothetical protein